jgi:MFS family permease
MFKKNNEEEYDMSMYQKLTSITTVIDDLDTREKKEHVIYRRGFGNYRRKLILILLVFTNIFINLDHGSIPAATSTLMAELKLDHVALGIIGSLVFLGITIGAIVAGPIFNTYAPKWIIIVSLLCISFFLYSFISATSTLYLAFSRVMCGFFQVDSNLNRFSHLYIFLYGLISLVYMS